jgi:uncharacterized protein
MSSDLLQVSPHDRRPPAAQGTASLVQIGKFAAPQWVPSRYNVFATTEDGRLILWNSHSGSLNAFEAGQKDAVLALLKQRSGLRGKREGVVGYLADRGFLVEQGTDEYRRVQYAYGRDQHRTDILELILLASEDCNFRCTYCYEAFARGTMRPEVRRGVRKLVESRLSSLKTLAISWFGGEPLYGWAAVEELAPFFHQTAVDNGLAFASHMTTNGYLLTPDVVDKLLAWRIDDFQITLDGPPEEHDRWRPTRDGQGSFDTIFRNLEAMARRRDDFSVILRVNFSPETHPHLGRLLDVLSTRFRDDSRFNLSFHPVGRWGGPNDDDFSVCVGNEGRLVKQQLRQAARERGFEIFGTLKKVHGPGAEVCYAARPYNYLIGADGKVMKCTIVLDAKEYNVVGKLHENGELELDEDKMALWTEPAFERDKQCQKCVILPLCQGIHCPKIRIEEERQPCPDLRMELKYEMRDVLAASEAKSRRVAAQAG